MAEKKKILIFSHAMEIGGAEKALLGLLDSLNTDEYDVSLFLMRHQGEWLKYIPEKIHLLPEIPSYTCLAVPIKEVFRNGRADIALARAYAKFKAKAFVKKHIGNHENDVGLQYSHKYTELFMKPVPGEYDLAVSFLTPHYFVADKVKARKKIAWIHTDYSNVNIDTESQRQMWNKYDHIVSISDECSASFISVFPELKDKIIRIDHIMPVSLIRRLAEEEHSGMDYNGIKLLSIGRFCYAKNFENIPYVCERLIRKGLNIRWYIIGYGDDSKINKAIQKTAMESHVVLLGKKVNPYPFIKACDVYVQPSRYEGRAITVIEAQIFSKPVIITDYATAQSQIQNGEDGVIVPLDNEKCADGIAEVLNNQALLHRLTVNCSSRDYSNTREAEKLYALLNER